MKYCFIIFKSFAFFKLVFLFTLSFGQLSDTVSPQYKVTLPEAHIGNLDIDTRLLDSYEKLPENYRQFYLEARQYFSENEQADFTDDKIIEAAHNHNITIISGPMLGNLKMKSVTMWLRPSTTAPVKINVLEQNGKEKKQYIRESLTPGKEERIVVDGLTAGTTYKYVVYAGDQKMSEGKFKTAPLTDQSDTLKITFGSCFHKIGLHNPNLSKQILNRNPHAMLFVGDIAVDDRENRINMHRSDYLLRDIAEPWRKLTSSVPVYATWDDHDYLNNDLSGVPERFTREDKEKLRQVWHQNWNNPENNAAGIYFNSRIGPVELIMLDTRSCRMVTKRGNYGSYLGAEQQKWLKNTLKNSTAPFKLISSGTMWSDYVSNGKDSWGTWDTVARNEIFNLIKTEDIPGVLLISGDRHGARGFRIPGVAGYPLYEFEAASLGGVPGPAAMAKNTNNQLFGYHGTEAIAFGEFTFYTKKDQPYVTFRLINQFGRILEEHNLSYDQLTAAP
jgi:alkaline phosphatase D